MRRKLELISFLAGLTLFVALLAKLGLARIINDMALVGWGFLYLLAISAVRHGSRTGSWIIAMEPEQRRKFGYVELFGARLAGEALNYLTHGPILGEPIKASIVGRKISTLHAISSLAVESLSYYLLALILTLGGAVALALRLSDVRLVALATVVALLGSSSLLLFWLAAKRRWPLLSGPLCFFMSRSGRPPSAAPIEIALRFEENIYAFRTRRGQSLALIMLLSALAHAAGLAEVYVILSMLAVEGNLLLDAYMIESATKAINFAFCFVPAQIGFYEGGSALLLKGLGADAATGFSLAILRKLRALFWAGLGLLLLSRYLMANRVTLGR